MKLTQGHYVDQKGKCFFVEAIGSDEKTKKKIAIYSDGKGDMFSAPLADLEKREWKIAERVKTW